MRACAFPGYPRLSKRRASSSAIRSLRDCGILYISNALSPGEHLLYSPLAGSPASADFGLDPQNFGELKVRTVVAAKLKGGFNRLLCRDQFAAISSASA